jgi:hypothetical protein
MGNAFDAAGPSRNDARYTQIKVSVAKEIAEAFKTACKTTGESMAFILSERMIEYAGAKRLPMSPVPLDTRKKRRKEAKELLARLERVLAAEMSATANTPENLRNSERYEEAESIVSALEEATEALREAYG